MARKRKEEPAGRRKPGTGYATQAKNGTWTGHYPKQPRGYHVKRGFDTRPAAEAWCDSLLARQSKKENVDKGQQRVSAWMDMWKRRESKERDWKAKMVADVEWKLGYVKPYIGDMALADVLPDDVDAIWDELRKSLAENTVRQIRAYLFQVFESARQRHYITYNPVIKPSRRKRAKQKEPVRLSVPQAVLLVRTSKASMFSSFYILAWWLVLTLGLRAGEICGLRWGDVDLDTCTLHILQAYNEVRGVTTQDKPKNDKTRHVAFPRALISLFERHKRDYLKRAARGMSAGTWKEHGLVFPGRSGMPMNPNSLRHQLHDLTDAAKLPPVTTHMLRHTAAKFYTDVGTEHMMTKAILGHTPDITGHYAPPDPDAMRPWVEKVWHVLSGEMEKQERKMG
jgi:integrase